MAKNILSRKEGVIVGDDVLKLFNYAQEKKFAIPAINVTSSSTVVAALEAARDKKAPIILQMSQGGALYFAGKVREFEIRHFHLYILTVDRVFPMATNRAQSLEQSLEPNIFVP